MIEKTKKRISEIKENKDKLNDYIGHLNEAYRSGKIRYEDYFRLYNNVLKEKSLKGWNDYYDRKLNEHEGELSHLEEKRDLSHALVVFLFLVFLMVLLMFIF